KGKLPVELPVLIVLQPVPQREKLTEDHDQFQLPQGLTMQQACACIERVPDEQDVLDSGSICNLGGCYLLNARDGDTLVIHDDRRRSGTSGQFGNGGDQIWTDCCIVDETRGRRTAGFDPAYERVMPRALG